MSKGNPVVHCRIDRETLAAVEAQIRMTKEHETRNTIMEDAVASFVAIAIREKLAKMKRSREGRKRKAARVSVLAASE
jgi:hypothetical protein